MGPGRARASPACATRSDVRDLHARAATPGCRCRCCARFAAPPRGAARRRRRAARAHRRRRLGPAGAARHRRRPAAQPRAHPALATCSTAPGARGATSTSPALIRADPEAAVRARRRDRPRVVLPGQGPLRPGDGAQQPAGLARLRGLDARASRSTSSACSTRPRASRGSRSSRSPTSPTPSGCSSSRCC